MPLHACECLDQWSLSLLSLRKLCFPQRRYFPSAYTQPRLITHSGDCLYTCHTHRPDCALANSIWRCRSLYKHLSLRCNIPFGLDDGPRQGRGHRGETTTAIYTALYTIFPPPLPPTPPWIGFGNFLISRLWNPERSGLLLPLPTSYLR